MEELLENEGTQDVLQAGNILPMHFYPDPALSVRCLPVPDQILGTPELHKLVMDMTATMYLSGGVGLAAPQIGVPWRLFICDIHANLQDKKPMLLTFVNPTIVEPSKETNRLREGCLSFPSVREIIERPAEVTIEAQDADGNPVRLRANGWLGRVMQHEVDHLDGITMLDRMGSIAKRQALKKMAKLRRVVSSDDRKKAKAQRKKEARARKKKKRRGK